jgi:hypothetical protein
MTRTSDRAMDSPAAQSQAEGLDEAVDESRQRIVARPDGFHWLASDGRQEFGPFTTLEETLAAMEAADEVDASEPGETLQEAEGEIGIANWIDPETGAPAEGQSLPRVQDE